MAVYNSEDNIAAVEQYGRKMKLLEVRRILETETDQEHTLTANQIAMKLEKLGFSKPDRKGIYDDVNVLNYFYRPSDKRKAKQACFIAKDEETFGYYMENRLFSVADLKLMIDAIQSSKFLSEAKTIELIEAASKATEAASGCFKPREEHEYQYPQQCGAHQCRY